MKLETLNRSGLGVPKAYLSGWLKALGHELLKKKIIGREQKSLGLIVVFVTPNEMQNLNHEFRGKNRPTDVLSFESDDPEVVGELVICPEVIKRQAKEHGLKQQEEYGYMLTHGVLHLLGYDHEQEEVEAQAMFELQDQLFAKLRDKSFS